MIKIFGLNSLTYLWGKLKDMFAAKYDKVGGEITGNVKIDGALTLDIEDEDYDAGIRFTRALDNNLGTTLTLTGYAGNSTYKPRIRNVGDPASDYDVANKKYVDSKIVTPDSYIVFLNSDGTIDTHSSSLTYSKIKSELTDYTTDVYLDVFYPYTENGTLKNARAHIPAMEDQDVNGGPIIFFGDIRLYEGTVVEVVFLLDSSNVLSNSITVRENALLKTNDIPTYSTSQMHYPTTKAVYDLVCVKDRAHYNVEVPSAIATAETVRGTHTVANTGDYLISVVCGAQYTGSTVDRVLTATIKVNGTSVASTVETSASSWYASAPFSVYQTLNAGDVVTFVTSANRDSAKGAGVWSFDVVQL